MKFGIILCSRLGSSRIPGKALHKINGLPILEHLLKRLIQTKIKTYVAVPLEEMKEFDSVTSRFEPERVYLVGGDKDDPLKRMAFVANDRDLDAIIRVCHDKIFIDPELVIRATRYFSDNDLDYLYSSTFTEGSRFEIISRKALRAAAEKFKNVEHVSYAIRAVTSNSHNWSVPKQFRSDVRLLIDYPEDVTLMNTIFSSLGNDATLRMVIEFCDHNPWTKKINRLPDLTIYTCAYNADRWLNKCMGSVVKQENFHRCEYIIIDDFSEDKTAFHASKLSAMYPNVSFIRNNENLGLAASSNIALRKARGKYIMRIDADDYFPSKTACRAMVVAMNNSGRDVIYPNNYFGSMTLVQKGRCSHHVGGAIFDRSAINHIKFTAKLRGHEGLDFFLRAKHQLKIGYLDSPMFFYRQHRTSMSKKDLEYRKKVKKDLYEKHAEVG